MRQLLIVGLLLGLGAAVCSAPALAQEAPPAEGGAAAALAEPAAPTAAPTVPAMATGDLIAMMIWPLLTAAVVMIWTSFGDWVNRDSQIFALGYQKWNPIIFFPFVILALALFFIPMPGWIRPIVLLVVLVATSIPYIVVHNKSVEPHQTVLTGGWWRHFFAAAMGKVGVKMSDQRQADYEKGAAVELMAMGAPGANEDNANLLIARQSPGYLLVKDLIVEMVRRRTDRVVLEYAPQGVAVRHEIDGVLHPGEPRDRESADVMLAVMKTLANLDPKERKRKQAGRFAAKYENQKHLLPIVTQGVANGERVIVSRLNDKAKPHTYESLGLREALQEKWSELMHRDQGFVVFSAMPTGGLTTMTNASIEETDRLMRDFFAIEEVNRREADIQNVTVHTYDASKGETPATIIPGLIRLYPNVYICRDLVDAESATLLMNEVNEDRLIITCMPAREAAEALLRLLQMKLPQSLLASVASGVLYQRLIRKLCPDCKVAYTPPPDVLKKLGIPQGKVQQLYRPPKPEEVEKPCQTCQGIGYFGRTGIFELLEVTDQMREILAKQPSLDLLKKAARADGQRSLQEEGILLVAKGVTSLPELMRVLK
jgi:type II secretory ATPase GspE/PulE/Tfp pilus assembly ATPase PilB-like protein